MAVDNARIMDFDAMNMGFVPIVAPHELPIVSLSQWIRAICRNSWSSTTIFTDRETDRIADDKTRALMRESLGGVLRRAVSRQTQIDSLGAGGKT